MEAEKKRSDQIISRKDFLKTLGGGVGLFALSMIGNSLGIDELTKHAKSNSNSSAYGSAPYGGRKSDS